jgi:1-phosphofructokinase family hexose kinase
MILTVTLNPLLELRLTYDSIEFGKSHRNPKEEFQAGGKGINVSRQLNCLKTPNMAFTFLGGNNGKKLRHLLEDEEIGFSSIRTEDETRFGSVVIGGSPVTVTNFFGRNSVVTENEVNEFLTKLEKMIGNCEIVVFSGSSPCENTGRIFIEGIKIANNQDKISVLDTYGSHLSECIDASPTIIHNNKTEIEQSLGRRLETEKEKIEFLNFLYSKGIKQSFITDGEKETYAANFDFHYVVENPLIEYVDSTGSGDAFVAGIVYGFHNNLVFEEYLRLAASLGAANAASTNVCKVTIEEIEQYKQKVKISNIGKKVKLIDDSP